MAVTWERLAGDTSKFAIKISLSDDPDEGAGVTRDESLSWGSFQIWVGGRNLTAHQHSGETFDSIHWYLLPFLEWWAANWDPLFHEEKLPNRNAAAVGEAALWDTRETPRLLADDDALAWEQNWYAWWHRHVIDAARFGGVFPAVCFRRWRHEVEISWNDDAASLRPPGVDFLQSSGAYRAAAESVTLPLFEVLREAAKHLLGRHSNSARLADLVTNIEALQSRRDDRLAWLLGLGSTLTEMKQSLNAVREFVSGLPAQARDAIFGTTNSSPLCTRPFSAALMFGAVSPRIDSEDRFELLRQLANATGNEPARIDDYVIEAPVATEESWRQAYSLAEQFAEQINIEPHQVQPIDVERLVRDLGITLGEIALNDASIRGIAIGGPSYQATILLNRNHVANRYPTGRRFSIAHELCHLLYDRAFAQDLAFASGEWAPRDVEKRANAFAAMLLMPSDRVSRLIRETTRPAASRELVIEVAKQLNTSFRATLEHLRNLGFIADEDRDAVLDEEVNRAVELSET